MDSDNNLEILGRVHGFELPESAGDLSCGDGLDFAASPIIKLYFSLLDIVREACSLKSKDSSAIVVNILVGRNRCDYQRN